MRLLCCWSVLSVTVRHVLYVSAISLFLAISNLLSLISYRIPFPMVDNVAFTLLSRVSRRIELHHLTDRSRRLRGEAEAESKLLFP
jgi:hypothetical protein